MIARHMLNNLQIQRAFAALNVLVYHILETAKTYGQHATAFAFLEGWGASGVDLFFVISGFVMVYTQATTPKSPWQFFRSRLVRIVPLYWLLTFAIVLVYLAWPSVFREMKLTLPHLFSSLLFLSKRVVQDNPVLSVGWTLEYEMLFYLLFALGLSVSRKWVALIPSVILAAMCFWGSVDLLVLEFVLGMLAATFYLRLVCHSSGVWILIAGAVLLAASLFIDRQLHAFFLWGIPSCLVVLGASCMPQSGSRLGRLLGDASYSMYLVQVFTIPAFYKAAGFSGIGMSSELMVVVCAALSVLASVLVHVLVEKRLVLAARRQRFGPLQNA